MEALEMISKALEAVVEQKVAEKATAVTIDSVLEFIKNADRKALNSMLVAISETSVGSNLIQDIYKDDIQADDVVNLVNEMDLNEFVFNEHWDNLDLFEKKEFIKDAIDNL